MATRKPRLASSFSSHVRLCNSLVLESSSKFHRRWNVIHLPAAQLATEISARVPSKMTATVSRWPRWPFKRISWRFGAFRPHPRFIFAPGSTHECLEDVISRACLCGFWWTFPPVCRFVPSSPRALSSHLGEEISPGLLTGVVDSTRKSQDAPEFTVLAVKSCNLTSLKFPGCVSVEANGSALRLGQRVLIP